MKSPEGGIAKRGDTLLCHVCNFEIAEIVKDIHFNEPIGPEMFKSKTRHPITKDTPMNCPSCGADVVVHGLMKILKEKNYAPVLRFPER